MTDEELAAIEARLAQAKAAYVAAGQDETWQWAMNEMSDEVNAAFGAYMTALIETNGALVAEVRELRQWVRVHQHCCGSKEHRDASAKMLKGR